MATQRVSFEITTDESGAISAFRKIGDEADRFGQRGSRAFQLVSKEQKRARDTAQLLRQTLGVEIPSGLEKILAKTPAVSGAMASMFRAGVVLTFAAALVGVVNNFEDIENSIKKAGFQLALFGDKVRSWFGGRSEVAEGVKVEMQQKFVHPILAQIQSVSNASALVLKEGVAALQEQRRQALAAADSLAEQQRREAGEKFGYDSKSYAEAEKLIAQTVGDLRKSIEVNTNKEIVKLRRQHAEELFNLQAESVAVGLKGTAQIMHRMTVEIDKINLRVKNGFDPGTAQKMIAEVKQIAGGKITELVRSAQLEEQKMRNETVEMAVEGEGLILEAAENRIAEEKRIHEELFTWFGDNNVQREEAERILRAKIVEIDRQAAIKLKKTREQFARETLQINQEAALLSVPPWQRANLEILADYERQLAELRRLKAASGMDDEQFASRAAALDRLKNAKIVEQNRQMLEQIADDYQSVFDDLTTGSLGKRIVSNFKKLAFQILAQFTLAGRGSGSLLGGLLGSLIFGPGSQTAGILGGAGAAAGGGGINLGSLFGLGVTGAGGPGGVFGGGAGPGGIFSFANPAANLGSLTGPIVGAAGRNFGFGPAAPIAGGASNFGFGDSSLASTATGALSLKSLFGGKAGLGKLAGGFGPLAALMLGQKFGGPAGLIGGAAAALGLSAAFGTSSLAYNIVNFLGVGATAGLAGGGIGFGVGSKYGKVAGILSGAGTGAGIGFLLGGPIGGLIGAIVGFFGGLFGGIFGGGKRKKAANKLVDNEVLPQITKLLDQYKGFQLDYASALEGLTQLQSDAETQLKKLKGEGKSVFKKRVIPAIADARKTIEGIEIERQRRAGLVFGPPQFHGGGFIGFSSNLRAGEVIIKAKKGEFVVNDRATAKNRPTLEAINAGESVGGITINGPLVQTNQRVDAEWLRNGGAQQIYRAIRHALKEGAF